MNMPGMPGMDPTTMARVVAHGKRIEEQMRRIQDRFEAIRGTATAKLDAALAGGPASEAGQEVAVYAEEGIVAVEELSRLMAVNPADLMGGDDA